MLAGLLKAPSRYAPTQDPAAAARRARIVIAAMQDAGFINAELAAEMAGQDIIITNRSTDGAHYAVDWTLDQLPDFVGRPRADLDVMTTLDRPMQLAAERAINRVLATQGEARQAGQAAMVVMTPDGAIRAMVGGRAYGKSQFNRAVQARRQPGSAFKPVVYLAALENGLAAGDVFDDAPLSINGWSPKNYDGRYRGAVTAGEAMAHSLNTVAVQISEQTGRDKVIDMARRLGLSGRLRAHPSLALGTFEVSLLQLTAAYAHFANGGQQVVPHIIQAVISASGQSLYDRLAPVALPVVDGRHIGVLNNMLRAVMTIGTGRAARLDGIALAGKTGTSQNWRDAWFIGYSGALVVGVWVGNDDGAAMARVSGGGLPAEIFAAFMAEQKELAASVALPEGALPKSGGIGALLRRLFGD
jgi:penicillin-binding protein 1A